MVYIYFASSSDRNLVDHNAISRRVEGKALTVHCKVNTCLPTQVPRYVAGYIPRYLGSHGTRAGSGSMHGPRKPMVSPSLTDQHHKMGTLRGIGTQTGCSTERLNTSQKGTKEHAH
ncbi:hypothetical protein VFPPC_17837 [Pochonia chlamydosporia 170]|uniref:Uncharacterized protein n=1 Tax=Pochonia chlamydosporia 170 TaxID=1380566 RepID=A0A219AQA0_METCM|nr:hypothetical protein VFPPC_17837 [Pochonia chlamydosporia 170]OWT42970.1 hypothetical protein VFPPC_17837 [Pochonia chlamydosporia 170]